MQRVMGPDKSAAAWAKLLANLWPSFLATLPISPHGRCKELADYIEGVLDNLVSVTQELNRETVAEISATRLWLDDVRPAPPGWVWKKTSREAIELLQSGSVSAVSLDYDLDRSTLSDHGNGAEVARWIVDNAGELKRISWNVHSRNPHGAERIRELLLQADRIWNKKEASMKRVATMKPCRKKDLDPDRPLSEQKICLYTKDGKRLLGRHPSEEAAKKQETAIQISKHAEAPPKYIRYRGAMYQRK